MAFRHLLTHHLNGTLEIEALSRAHIQLKRDLIQLILAID